jgi:hypothetical protein
MPVNREIVGDPYLYHGRTVTGRYAGPDLLCYVNDVELPHFYADLEAVRGAGRRWIDHEIEEARKRENERKPLR